MIIISQDMCGIPGVIVDEILNYEQIIRTSINIRTLL